MRNMKAILTTFGVTAAAGVLVTAGAPAAWACSVDKDCSQTCGGQTCYWSGGPYGDYCVDASDPAHSWCTADLDCNCSGATCSGNHCSIVLPASGTTGGTGTTTGGATTGTTGGGSTTGAGTTGGSTTGAASTTSGGGTTGGTVGVGSPCNVDKDCSATCGGLTCDWNSGHTCQLASTPANSWCNSAADCNCAGATCSSSFHCSIVTAAAGTSGGSTTTTGGAYATSGGCSTSGGSSGLVLGLGLLAGLAFMRRRL